MTDRPIVSQWIKCGTFSSPLIGGADHAVHLMQPVGNPQLFPADEDPYRDFFAHVTIEYNVAPF